MKNMLLKTTVASLLTFALCLTGMAGAGNLPGEGKTVQPARATWTTGFVLEAIYSRALEDLGYEVKDPKKLANPMFYESLGQGDVDFWANGWFPLHNTQLPANFEEKSEKVGYVVKSGAIQGYLASKEHVEKFNITSLADFKRPEVKKAFDANGDGKADLVGCPPGWGCEKAISFHMDAYDLRDHINVIKASYSASMADAIARYNDGDPIIFNTWTPNWTVNKLVPGEDVLWVNVPETIPNPGQEGFEDAMVGHDIPGAVTDPIKFGMVANDIVVVANKEWLKDNPSAKKMFQLMSVSMEYIADQNNKMFEGEDTQEDIERHATEWIKANQDKWDKWLKAAIAASE